MNTRGFDEKIGGWPMPWPCNMHDHYRSDPAMMQIAVPEAARYYRYATAMPNLGPDRIRMPKQAIEYREKILFLGRTINPAFDVNVPLYLEPDTDPRVAREGFEKGAWIAAKLYPKGGTTQSAEGVDFREIERLYPVFDVMRELNMTLLIHAEPQWTTGGKEIDVFHREVLAQPYVDDIFHNIPGIKIVFEHVSSKDTLPHLEEWRKNGYHIGATVAPQYLVWNRNDLFRGGMNPLRYSIPVLKRESDRAALVSFVTHSDVVFLGTDCAPHSENAKSKPMGCPGGVFNNPVALFKYFEVFKNSGHPDWFDRFVEFACSRGPRFYGLPVDDRDAIAIVEDPWTVADAYTSDPRGTVTVIPMCAGEKMQHRVKYL